VPDVTTTRSSSVKFLPALFRGPGEEVLFFERFLKIFEAVLTGTGDTEVTGLSEVLSAVHEYFLPDTAPKEFLDWLASWLGLALKEDWSEEKKRKIIGKIVPLYRIRGTKRGLQEFLKIYVDGDVSIVDGVSPLQVGIHSTVGQDAVIGGLPPYFFYVNLNLAVAELKTRQRKIKTINEIIGAEKPVHTDYLLTIKSPTMQVGVNSTVGRDTLLGGVFT
jgi:phage tail-like protein